MKALIVHSELALRQMLRASWSLSLSLTFLALALGVPARSQEPANPEDSIADPARNARERKPNPATPPRIFTNDDLAVQSLLPGAAAIPPESSPERAEAPTSQETDCNNPADDERLKMELQAAQEELDQIRRELSYDPKVISNGDVDLKNFKSGSSGLAFGSLPLLQSQPQSPARINEVLLEEEIASLKQASRVACDSPEDAAIQKQLDSTEGELKSLRLKIELDPAAYFFKTD